MSRRKCALAAGCRSSWLRSRSTTPVPACSFGPLSEDGCACLPSPICPPARPPSLGLLLSLGASHQVSAFLTPPHSRAAGRRAARQAMARSGSRQASGEAGDGNETKGHRWRALTTAAKAHLHEGAQAVARALHRNLQPKQLLLRRVVLLRHLHHAPLLRAAAGRRAGGRAGGRVGERRDGGCADQRATSGRTASAHALRAICKQDSARLPVRPFRSTALALAHCQREVERSC